MVCLDTEIGAALMRGDRSQIPRPEAYRQAVVGVLNSYAEQGWELDTFRSFRTESLGNVVESEYAIFRSPIVAP
jgi:hypothetical protein